MSDTDKSRYTPAHPPPKDYNMRKRKSDTTISSNKTKRRRLRSRHSSREPRDDGYSRKQIRTSSPSSSYSSRSSRSPLRKESSKRKRHRRQSKRSSRSSRRYKRHAYRKSRRDSLSSASSQDSSISSSDSLSSNSDRSRSKIRRPTKKRLRVRSTDNDSKQFVKEFIEAINNRTSNSYVGAQEVIPQFDPSQKTQNTRAWLRKVNEVASIYGWSERQIIYHALPKLSGLARRWYEGLTSIDLSWNEWQRKLLKCFPDDRNYADRLSEMLNRRSRREETLEEYFYEKAKLVSRCNIRGKDAVDCIIHGIFDHNIQLNAQGSNFKRPSQLLRYLRSISVKNVRTMTDTKKPILPNKINSNRLTDRAAKQNAPRGVRCYNCSEVGHTVPKCPKPLQKCIRCQRMGHIAEHCKRELMPDKNLAEAVANIKEVQQIHSQGKKSNIYHKIVKVNGTERSAFVDFGSQCTIITRSTVEHLNLLLKSDNLPVMKGFAFGAIIPLGYTMIDLSIDFVHAEIQAFVVADEYISTDVLIGQNLTELPDVIVYKTNKNLILYSEKTELGKIKVFASASTELVGIQCLSIRSEIFETGYIYIPGSTSFKLSK